MGIQQNYHAEFEAHRLRQRRVGETGDKGPKGPIGSAADVESEAHGYRQRRSSGPPGVSGPGHDFVPEKGVKGVRGDRG